MAGSGEPELEALVLHAASEPIDGALSMAVDEVLLARSAVPVLRVWRWKETTVSIGCFVRVAEARALRGGEGGECPLVRRWTGGGCVRHERGRDVSYSLVVPRGAETARMRPVESYRWIHGRLAEVLRGSGLGVGMATGSSLAGGAFRDCFRRPVPFDLIDVRSGGKIAGAGQKRTRQGMLHQGNLRAIDLPPGFPGRLAAAIAAEVREDVPGGGLLAEARELREKKYTSADWTAKY